MSESHQQNTTLPHEELNQIEALLFEFDQRWQQDLLSQFASHLNNDALRQPAIFGLIGIDLERCWNQGIHKYLEEYCKDFPELGSIESLPTELIHSEVLAREQSSDPLDDDELQRRFPQQADQVRHLMQQSRDSQSGTADSKKLQANIDTSQVSMSTDYPATSVGKEAELPKRFGRYEILRRLGSGAMGAVYLAHDTKLDRPVALKIPKLDNSENPSELVKRFYREARAAATVRHPNICPVYDVGKIENRHYLTMAYLEGHTLADYLHSEKKITPAVVAQLIRKTALGLTEAHAHGFIHRDLKPTNIMIDKNQEPVVMDFGLARRVIRLNSGVVTQTGMILGTPAYMSPEQVEAIQDEIGPSTDQYGLGVIFYQMLTGKLPFTGSAAALIGKIMTEQPSPPSIFCEELDSELEAICLKMMEKYPDERYSSMEELAKVLSDWLRKNKTQENDDANFLSTFILPPLAEKVGDTSAHIEKDEKFAPSEQPSLKSGAHRGGFSSRMKWIAGGLVVPLILLMAGIIIMFKDGTVVEIPEDNNVQIETNKDGSLKNINISPVNALDNRATDFLTCPEKARQTKTTQAEHKKNGTENIDQQVAERVLKLGGWVYVRKEGSSKALAIKPGKQLPTEDFHLVEIWFNKRKVEQTDYDLITHLEHLDRITLFKCETTDESFQIIAKIPTLEKVAFQGPVTDTCMNFIRELPKLTSLEIWSPLITDAGISHLANLKRLKSLSLSSPLITGKGFEVVGGLPGLKELCLSGTSITDADLAQIGKLTNLHELTIEPGRKHPTQIDGPGLTHLRELKQLKKLALRQLSVEDADLEHLKDFSELISLDLRGTNVTGKEFDMLGQLNKLSFLDLRNTPFTDEGLKYVSLCHNLKRLTLSGTNISNLGLEQISTLNQLENLYLEETKITDSGLKHLSSLPRLTYLNLAGTKITDECLSQLQQLSMLRLLNIRETEVSVAGIEKIKNTLPQCRVELNTRDTQ